MSGGGQGFASTLDAILENLPHSRQVLLFSATQTKKVRPACWLNAFPLLACVRLVV